MDPTLPYCEKFGFDTEKIKHRLAFLYLSEFDARLAERLRDEVIEPNLDTIIDRFYEILMYQPESRKILISGGIIERLKKKQRAYLLSLGINFNTAEYFEERLRIGMVHAWVGLPLGVYQCAYRGLSQIIIDLLPPFTQANAKDNKAFISLLLKITTLDMSLAIDTYHSSQLADLEEEVTRMHEQEDHLRYQASTDSLTGLMNHENSFHYLEESIKIARKIKNPVSVIMADLDYFKRVNDDHGHRVGDAVLREVAARILSSVRAPDAVGRYGGEEFIIILSDANPDTARTIAERIRAHVAGTPINVQGVKINITISLGVTTMTANDDRDSMVTRADEALYAAKSAGRDCIRVAD